MSARASLIAALICVTAGPGLAQPAAPTEGGGRYDLREVRAGYLRLDRQSGAVSLCRERGETWTCALIADDRDAYSDEIEALRAEKAALEARVAALEARLDEIAGLAGRPLSPAEGTPDEAAGRSLGADRPSGTEEEDLDRALDFTEDAMRRLLGVLREFQRDMEPDRGSAQ